MLSSLEHGKRPGGGQGVRDAIRKARTIQAERTDVIVELQAAEVARLEVLAEELESVFAEIPNSGDQFECSLVPGNPPRLWIDMVSYVVMASDKHTYKFVRDTRSGRKVLVESADIPDLKGTITGYIAHRVIERERALEAGDGFDSGTVMRGHGGLTLGLSFLAGICVGVIAVFMLALALTAP